MKFYPGIENLILPVLSYQGCQVRTVQWFYWNSRTWSSSDVIISCRISGYSGTSVSFFFKYENAVFEGVQEKRIHYPRDANR